MLGEAVDRVAVDDLFFPEDWEEQPVPSFAALLRVRQIQLAQPALAAEVRAEITARRHAGPARTGMPRQPASSSLLRMRP